MRFLDANPELRELTAGTVRQEGYLKSIGAEQSTPEGADPDTRARVATSGS